MANHETWTSRDTGTSCSARTVTRLALCGEFALAASDASDLGEWLGQAESVAWAEGGAGGELPEEWAGFHGAPRSPLCSRRRQATRRRTAEN